MINSVFYNHRWKQVTACLSPSIDVFWEPLIYKVGIERKQ